MLLYLTRFWLSLAFLYINLSSSSSYCFPSFVLLRMLWPSCAVTSATRLQTLKVRTFRGRYVVSFRPPVLQRPLDTKIARLLPPSLPPKPGITGGKQLASCIVLPLSFCIQPANQCCSLSPIWTTSMLDQHWHYRRDSSSSTSLEKKFDSVCTILTGTRQTNPHHGRLSTCEWTLSAVHVI